MWACPMYSLANGIGPEGLERAESCHLRLQQRGAWGKPQVLGVPLLLFICLRVQCIFIEDQKEIIKWSSMRNISRKKL